jgi:hypothetical protein
MKEPSGLFHSDAESSAKEDEETTTVLHKQHSRAQQVRKV